MANFSTSRDLIRNALQWVGELTDGTSEFNSKAVEYLNRTHLAILAGSNEFNIELGEPWSWGKSQYPGTLALDVQYDTGTISLTNASISGTFSSAPAASLAGYYLRVDDRSDFYRIATHTASTTSFTLDQAYQDATGATLGYTAYKLDYTTTTGILRLISPLRVYQTQTYEANDEGHIEGVAKEALLRDYPLHRLESGIPTMFAIQYHDSSAGSFQLRFNKIVSAKARVEYEYIPIPTDLTDSDSSIPLVPREHRATLAYGVAYYLAIDKSDSKADAFYKNLTMGLESLVQANRRQSANTGRKILMLTPRRDLITTRVVVQETAVD